MTPNQPYSLVYAEAIQQQLRAIDAKHHSLIRDKIVKQLSFEPDRESRNRKPLERPVEFGATWELRFGPGNRFRVFYDTDAELHQVQIVAVGVKLGNRLRIGREELEL